jgi:hypothetical protein
MRMMVRMGFDQHRERSPARLLDLHLACNGSG